MNYVNTVDKDTPRNLCLNIHCRMVASYPNICQVSLHFWKPQWWLLNPGCFQNQSTPHVQVVSYICAIVSCQPLRHRSFAPFRSWMSSNSWLPDLFIAVSWRIWMFVGPSKKSVWINMSYVYKKVLVGKPWLSGHSVACSCCYLGLANFLMWSNGAVFFLRSGQSLLINFYFLCLICRTSQFQRWSITESFTNLVLAESSMLLVWSPCVYSIL